MISTAIFRSNTLWNKVKVLLVGGFSFIGTRFLKKFATKYELIVYAKKESVNTIKDNNIPGLLVETGTIEDASIQEIVKKYHPQVVIHAASLTGLKECEKNPENAFKVNVFGTFNVVKACLDSNAKLIFLSSREVYGETQSNASREDDPLLPKNVYGITKMIGEFLIKYASKKNNLDYTILRLTNVYGPGGKGGANRIIKTAIEDEKIQINGGEQLLNFIYVDDVVDLIKLVIDNKSSSKQIVNVGSNDTLTIKDFAEKVSKLFNKDIVFEFLPRVEIENNKFKPNLEKLEKVLGFSAKTSLEEGIVRTIEHYKKMNVV